MMPGYSVIEFEHGLSSFQEKMTSESSDLDILMSSVIELEVEEEREIQPSVATPANPPEVCPTIFKVPHRLREVNEKAYEPNVISIGPYHYRKPHLARLEDLKKRWFEKFVEKPHLGLHQFREAMKLLEGKTRKCYEPPLPPDLKDEANFVDMMVYDGCFVVQLIRWKAFLLYYLRELGRHVPAEMRLDLLLLENQLPFFVLLKLYSMINPNPEPGWHFNDLAKSALAFFGGDSLSLPENTTSTKHLLDLVHATFHPSPPEIRAIEVPCCVSINTSIKHILHLVRTTFHPSGIQAEAEKEEENLRSSRKSMPSTTEMEDAGIRFSHPPNLNNQNQEKWKERMFGITFDNGTKKLKIPTLEVDDFTERLLRNYTAYEQFLPPGQPTYFVDYVVFIDDLINTSKDVELLRKSGIIDNLLGNDEAVTQMFNKLCNSIFYSSERFYYNEIANQVNTHCKRRRNIWKAKLKKDYFNTPWSPVSFVAAFVLLVLTTQQSIYSVLSYHHGRQ